MSELQQIVEDAHTVQRHALTNLALEKGIPLPEVKNPVVSLKTGRFITEEQSAEFGMFDHLYRQYVGDENEPPTTEQVLAYLDPLAGALDEIGLKRSAGEVKALREKVSDASG